VVVRWVQVDRAELERQLPPQILASIPQPPSQPHGLFTLYTDQHVADVILR
jgi:hypothetical protein